MVSYIVIILMIVFLESILSVDNAAVLAVIAQKAGKDANKAVKYGIWGAFLFRGLSLFAVSWLMLNPEYGGYGKILGALYLIRLGYKGLTDEQDSTEEGDVSWIDNIFSKIGISGFWLIVLEIEIIDLVFSIDNLFACVAFTENIEGNFIWFGYTLHKAITLTVIGVILGIICMRFVTTSFIKLMEKYPSLNKSAMIVILLLGVKLFMSGLTVFYDLGMVNKILDNHATDFVFSGIMMLIFFVPIMFNKNKKVYMDNKDGMYYHSDEFNLLTKGGNPKMNKKSRVTVCGVITGDELLLGWAKCSHKDKFIKRVGRKISADRCLSIKDTKNSCCIDISSYRNGEGRLTETPYKVFTKYAEEIIEDIMNNRRVVTDEEEITAGALHDAEPKLS